MASTLADNSSRTLPASGRKREQEIRLFASTRRYDCKRLQLFRTVAPVRREGWASDEAGSGLPAGRLSLLISPRDRHLIDPRGPGRALESTLGVVALLGGIKKLGVTVLIR